MNSRPSAPDGYELIEMVGRGGYSEVWKAVHKATNTEVAIKIFRKSAITKDSDIAVVRNEIEIHRLLSHRYIVQLFDFSETVFNFYFIMEFVPCGTLADMIKKHSFLDAKTFQPIFAQIILALDYLHSKLNIGHMDLKPQNILLDEDTNIRISDFGLSKKFTDDSIPNPKQGTLHYFAPERLSSDTVTKAVDIWSLGVILYYALVGAFPFEGSTRKSIMKKIVSSEPDYPAFLGKDISELLHGMLTKNPLERMTIEDIKMNKWVKEALLREPPLFVKYAALCPRNVRLLETITGKNKLTCAGCVSTPGMRKKSSEAMLKLFSSGKFKALSTENKSKSNNTRKHRTINATNQMHVSRSMPSDLVI